MNDKNYSNTKGNKQLELSSKHIVTKSITFNELCPIWSKKLSLGIDRVDKFLVERDSLNEMDFVTMRFDENSNCLFPLVLE